MLDARLEVLETKLLFKVLISKEVHETKVQLSEDCLMPRKMYVRLQIIKRVTWVTDAPVEILQTNLLLIRCPNFV